MAVAGVVLDSSAVIAVLREESGHRRLQSKLESAGNVVIGAPTLYETATTAILRCGDQGDVAVKEFLQAWRVQVLAFGKYHWRAATEAFRHYGAGRHPAALDYGACMTYATARLAELPLLFVGNDFARTDIAPA